MSNPKYRIKEIYIISQETERISNSTFLACIQWKLAEMKKRGGQNNFQICKMCPQNLYGENGTFMGKKN